MWRTVLLILFERVNLSFDENALLTVVTNPRSFMAVNQGNLMGLLGDGTLLEYDDRQQKAIMQFDVRPEFCHSDVTVAQGGFVPAWMKAAMAHVVGSASHGQFSVVILELKVTVASTAGPGQVVAEAWVLSMGRTIAFLEGQLSDPAGKLLATSSSTAKLVPDNR